MGQSLYLKRGASQQAFGSIVLNTSGFILMCTAEQQPGLLQWHLPTATPLANENPVATALRSLQYLTDIPVRVVGKLPSSFAHCDLVTDYFLMTPTRMDACAVIAPNLRWVLPDDALAEIDHPNEANPRPDWQAIHQLHKFKNQVLALIRR